MRSKNILCIDAGGTFFKYGIYTPDGECLSGVQKEPSHSDEDKDAILGVYRKLIMKVSSAYDIGAIGVSTPGPFEYRTGTSRMKHKFQGIYGISLKEELSCDTDCELFFLSDTNAFLLGEFTDELQKSYRNILGVTIGTGLGMSVIHNAKLLTTPDGGVVEKPYCVPYGNGIAEDVISARGITASFDGKSSAKEVSELANKGNETAKAVYQKMGAALCEILTPYVKKYEADLLILGGQVSKSLPLFSKELTPLNLHVLPAQFADEAALKGICRQYCAHLQ